MSFTQKEEAILEAWLPKADDLAALLQGPGTRLLNLVGPPFSGKSTAAPALMRRISAKTPFVFIYVAKTQLDVENLSRECAPVWQRCGTGAIHILTYEGLQEKLLRDGLPGFSVVFFDEDPDASVSYVIAWLSLCVCAAKQTEETRLRIVAISEAEVSPWQKASLTKLAKTYITSLTSPDSTSSDGISFNLAKKSFLATFVVARRGFLNKFVENSHPPEKRVMLFYGDHATLARWMKGLNPQAGRAPVQVLTVRNTSSTAAINRFINLVAMARPGDRLAVCIHPGVRISLEQASKFRFTHVMVHGRDRVGIDFSKSSGNFVNDRKTKGPADWEILRALMLGSSYEALPTSSVMCPSALYLEEFETQLYRQKDLLAFVLSCIDLSSRHKIRFSDVTHAFRDDLETEVRLEMLRRLTLGKLIACPEPGEYTPGQTDRARAVCEWLPLAHNNFSAARLMAGVQLYKGNVPLQRTIMAMAIIFAYSDTPFFRIKHGCLLSGNDMSSRLIDFFYKKEHAAISLRDGYLWHALEVFRWAINTGDVGKLNKGGKLFLAQVLEVDENILGKMYAHYLRIAAKVGHSLRNPDGSRDAVRLSPIKSSYVTILLDELLCCSLDRLYSIHRSPQSAMVTTDLVSERKIKPGPNCRLLVLDSDELGELQRMERGAFAVSISPNVSKPSNSFEVPNLTRIPDETMRRFRTLRIAEDSIGTTRYVHHQNGLFQSRYPRK